MNALGGALALLVTVPTVLAFAGGLAWFFELASPFRVQYAVVALVAFALTFHRPGPWRFVAAFAAVVNFAHVAAVSFAPTPDTDHDPNAEPLTVMSFNVQTSNDAYAEVRDAIRHHAPDILVLLEVNNTWMRELSDLEGYKRVGAVPRSDNFGIAAWSSVPVSSLRVHLLSQATVPTLELVVPRRTGDVVVLGTHTLPPIGAEATERRDEQLLNLARFAKTSTRATVIVGDLNVTPFSAIFDEMIELGDLHRASTSLTPTWPAHSPGLTALLGIPIDHALLSRTLRATHFEIGENCGSDHRAVIVTFQ